jgi:hypothetical protein
MLRSANRTRSAAITAALVFSAATHAATYTTPHQLALSDVYRLNQDGYTGDENTTQPKADLNDGQNGDNPYYQRTNVAGAHNSGFCTYWYTSAHPGRASRGRAASTARTELRAPERCWGTRYLRTL